MKKRIHRHIKKHKRSYKHIPFAVFFYLLFSFSLFLGLQVDPIYGNAGIIITGIISVLYIYSHTKDIKRHPTHNPLRKRK